MKINANPSSIGKPKIPKVKPVPMPKAAKPKGSLGRTAALQRPPISASMFGDTKQTSLAPLGKLMRAGGALEE